MSAVGSAFSGYRMMDIVYNVALALVTLAAAFAIRRGRTVQRLLVVAAFVPVAAAMALVLDRGMFGAMRLLAYGVFVHWAVLLLLAAVWSRRSARATLVWAAAAACVVCIGVDAFAIEPGWLEVSHVALTSAKLARPLRIVVLSDIQYDDFGDYQRRVYRRVLDEHPDLVLMTGDYIQTDSAQRRRELTEATRDYLSEIHFSAPLGVYAVRGNVENDDWPELFDGLPVRAFPATGRVEQDALAITALSLEDSFYEGMAVRPADRFHVVFGHAPNFALGDVQADLLVAGHTHGGQVRLPLVGPIVTLSAVPSAWAAGVTALSAGRTLVVSRGAGMERGRAPRLRFLCRPEIVVIDVRPAGQ
jgi:predicted MPP superfamily phosphohydrolase